MNVFILFVKIGKVEIDFNEIDKIENSTDKDEKVGYLKVERYIRIYKDIKNILDKKEEVKVI